MNNYRIKEHLGRFIIEIEVKETIGMLWWKKEVVKWRTTNTYGTACIQMLQSNSKSFKSLKKAKKQIKTWQKEPVYHQ